MIQMKKMELRRHYRLVRKLVLQHHKSVIEDAIMHQVISIINQVGGKNVASFFPKNDEISILLLKEKLPEKDFLLPRTCTPNKVLDFYLSSLEKSDLEFHGKYRIYEPFTNNEKRLPDVILVPLLAFDHKLHRVGYGGGYYDATIAHLKEIGHKFTSIGIAHSALQVSEIITSETDMALDYIATEHGVLKIS